MWMSFIPAAAPASMSHARSRRTTGGRSRRAISRGGRSRMSFRLRFDLNDDVLFGSRHYRRAIGGNACGVLRSLGEPVGGGEKDPVKECADDGQDDRRRDGQRAEFLMRLGWGAGEGGVGRFGAEEQ